MILNHWTEQDPEYERPPLSLSYLPSYLLIWSFIRDAKDENGKPKYTLRPLWQRLGGVTAAVGFGVTIAFGLRFIRNRTIRALTLHSNKSRIFLQSVAHNRQKGLDLDKSACDLLPGRGVYLGYVGPH